MNRRLFAITLLGAALFSGPSESAMAIVPCVSAREAARSAAVIVEARCLEDDARGWPVFRVLRVLKGEVEETRIAVANFKDMWVTPDLDWAKSLKALPRRVVLFLDRFPGLEARDDYVLASRKTPPHSCVKYLTEDKVYGYWQIMNPGSPVLVAREDGGSDAETPAAMFSDIAEVAPYAKPPVSWRLRPPPSKADRAGAAALIADLDAAELAKREAATQELLWLGALDALEAARPSSPEQHARIALLIGRLSPLAELDRDRVYRSPGALLRLLESPNEGAEAVAGAWRRLRAILPGLSEAELAPKDGGPWARADFDRLEGWIAEALPRLAWSQAKQAYERSEARPKYSEAQRAFFEESRRHIDFYREERRGYEAIPIAFLRRCIEHLKGDEPRLRGRAFDTLVLTTLRSGLPADKKWVDANLPQAFRDKPELAVRERIKARLAAPSLRHGYVGKRICAQAAAATGDDAFIKECCETLLGLLPDAGRGTCYTEIFWALLAFGDRGSPHVQRAYQAAAEKSALRESLRDILARLKDPSVIPGLIAILDLGRDGPAQPAYILSSYLDGELDSATREMILAALRRALHLEGRPENRYYAARTLIGHKEKAGLTTLIELVTEQSFLHSALEYDTRALLKKVSGLNWEPIREGQPKKLAELQARLRTWWASAPSGFEDWK